MNFQVPINSLSELRHCDTRKTLKISYKDPEGFCEKFKIISIGKLGVIVKDITDLYETEPFALEIQKSEITGMLLSKERAFD